MCKMTIWDRKPSNHTIPLYYPSTAFLSVRPHCPNARQNRCQDDHKRFLLWELEETTGTPTSMKTIQQPITSGLMKQFMWLRIVHSGDCCPCLAVCTLSGAYQNRRMWNIPSKYHVTAHCSNHSSNCFPVRWKTTPSTARPSVTIQCYFTGGSTQNDSTSMTLRRLQRMIVTQHQ